MANVSYIRKGIVPHKYWLIVDDYNVLIKKYPKTHITRYKDLSPFIRKEIREGKKRISVKKMMKKKR